MIASAAIPLAIIESGSGEQMKPQLRRPPLALWLVVSLGRCGLSRVRLRTTAGVKE
jgi:hypothetical protein